MIIACKQLLLYVIVCPIFFVAAKLIGQQESFEFSFKDTGRNFVNTLHIAHFGLCTVYSVQYRLYNRVCTGKGMY